VAELSDRSIYYPSADRQATRALVEAVLTEALSQDD
jgi:hypothetical protein